MSYLRLSCRICGVDGLGVFDVGMLHVLGNP